MTAYGCIMMINDVKGILWWDHVDKDVSHFNLEISYLKSSELDLFGFRGFKISMSWVIRSYFHVSRFTG